MTLLVVTDSKGFLTLHEPDEEGKPGDLVASVWRDDWLPALLKAATPTALPSAEDALREALIGQIKQLGCTMVEICEPHPGNPSANIIPVDRERLIAALQSPRASDEVLGEVSEIRRAIRDWIAAQDDSDADISPLQYLMNREDSLADAILALRTPEPNSGGEVDHG